MEEEIYGKEVMEQCIADKAIVDMIVECWKEKDISKRRKTKLNLKINLRRNQKK